MFVPVNLHYRVRLGHLRQTGFRHLQETEHQPDGRDGKKAPGDRPVPDEPFHKFVVPAADRFVKVDFLQKRTRTETIRTLEPPVIIDRNHKDGHDVGGQQHDGHRHSLIVEHRPGDAAHEYQRNEHRAGCQHGAEHRSPHLFRALKDSGAQVPFTLPSAGYIIDKDDRVVSHHSDSEKQTGEGYNIQGQSDGIEAEHREYQRHRHRQDHQHRRAEVPHEEEYDDARQKEGDHDVLQQVVDGIFKKLGLVSRDLEAQLRVVVPETVHQTVHGRLQV